MGVGASLQVVACRNEVVASCRLEPIENQWWEGGGACLCITTIIRCGFLPYGFPLISVVYVHDDYVLIFCI